MGESGPKMQALTIFLSKLWMLKCIINVFILIYYLFLFIICVINI